MIKTDKVIYRTRTLEEYDWLMEKLEEAGCEWENGSPAVDDDEDWNSAMSDSHIWLRDKIISYSFPEFFYDYYKVNQDFEIIEVSDLMGNEEKKNLIKTDKVIYRTMAPKEYDWLMDKLEEAECEWQGGGSPVCGKEICDSTKSDSYICVENETISFFDEDYLYHYLNNLDYEIIEVSDLMKNEKKTEILDKLETMNEYLNNKLKKLEKEDDESQKIKKIVYTTEVYFE